MNHLIPGLLLVAVVCELSAADLVFTGRVVRAGRESVSVRLGDHRVIDARVGADADKLAVGEEVELTCKSIPRVWEEDTGRYQFLEVKGVRVLKAAIPEEARRRTVAGPADGNASMEPEGESKLEQAREVNLDYASSLPNFVARETATRYRADPRSPRKWRRVDVIETEITFSGNRVVRKGIRRNGKPWEQPFEALQGFKWSGGFGSEIRPLFDPQCPTSMQFEGRTKLRGKQLLAYRFTSPEDGCFNVFYSEYQRYNPARKGHFYIDRDGRLMQMDEEATAFPEGFEFAERREEVVWDDVPIGSASHLVPVEAHFVVGYSSGIRWRVDVAYTNHRHFEASSGIVFP